MEIPVSNINKEERTYPRVNVPEQMQVHFSFHGNQYNLSFPMITEIDTGEMGDLIENTDPRNLSGLIDQMAEWIKSCASGYRLVIFKDIKPSTVEEKLIAQTGKTLYLPSTKGSFPSLIKLTISLLMSRRVTVNPTLANASPKGIPTCPHPPMMQRFLILCIESYFTP